MRILLINTVPTDKNGITNVIFNYLKALPEDGIIYDYLSINHPSQSYVESVETRGGKVIVVDKFGELRNYVFRIRKIVNAGNYDAVHIHANSHTVCIDLLGVWLSGCKVRIIHAHNTHCNNLLVHKLLTLPFRFLCTHRLACGKDAGRFMFGRKKFTIINNGVDTGKYLFTKDLRKSMRNSLSLKDEFITVGHIGMFNEAKNQSFLVDVFAALVKRNLNYRLLLIGDGSLRPKVEQKVADLGLKSKVTFTGNIDNVSDYLNAVDIIVMPSLFEGLPLTLIEQQANGLQCIVSNAITTEADKTGNLRFLSLNAPVSEWVQSIEDCDCKQGREQRSKAAVESIKQCGYSIQEEAQKLKEYYINAVGV